MEWASCPLSIFSRFLYTSRFPIPDSPLPSLKRKPQLGATLCSKLYRWGFSEGIKFVKKVLQGKEVGAGVPGNGRPGSGQGFRSINWLPIDRRRPRKKTFDIRSMFCVC
ncbi:hypothetical protein [Moorena sp. SIO3H5]|uniref:hypothetical protein n=1 Tax=Moorena sp. SIO3H5 TaxID=2607834 RepID=UPI0013BC3460|nr:hypothetical protein [Moorena sp. SIO3H5]NEO74194.1 hypothetical protein [Moorena sp. SIO3H5]